MEMQTAKKQSGKSALERRLSNLTVQAMENFCNIKGITGISELRKKDLIEAVIRLANPEDLEEFLSTIEAEYLMDSFRRAIKWGKSQILVHIGEGASEKELHAEFNGLDVGLRRVYYIDFYNTNDGGAIRTSCECDDSMEKGLFCPHQMAVLLKAIEKKKIKLGKWKGPMTPEIRGSILALFPSAK
jgi:hypothetical protein